MSQRRIELHNVLVDVLGSKHVYFQPPSTVKMDYPCIVYRRNSVQTIFGDDSLYHRRTRYQVMVIDANPDSEIPDKVARLSLCSFDRHYTSNNLNHDVYNIYY